MYRLAILLVIILIIVRVTYYEKYTRALDGAYAPPGTPGVYPTRSMYAPRVEGV